METNVLFPSYMLHCLGLIVKKLHINSLKVVFEG